MLFERQTKRLFKKYLSLKNELIQLVQELKENPEQGKGIGKNCCKIRIAIASKGKEKSGGARIITHIVISKDTVYLLSIYDKSDQEALSQNGLDELLKYVSDDL